MTRSTTAPEAELELVVAGRTDEADGVVSLDLRRADGASLPGWAPGAHIDLLLAPDLVRQYSLCSPPEEAEVWRVAVLLEKDGRGGSLHVHDTLVEGDVVRVRGPRNHFRLERAERYLFIAGGIGVTPIIPMVAEAERLGAAWEMAYGGRTLASMAFRDELLTRHDERVRIRPEDEYGRLDLDALLGTPQPGTLVYCCGPEPLLKAVEERCADWPDGALHLERFTPKELQAPLRDAAFDVELAQSGITVTVPPDKSVLQAVEEAGVQVLSSCQEGTCGTCETAVLDGTVDHRDSLLTPAEQSSHDTMMICISRASCPRLVLDL
ncbi:MULTISPECIES: PDR/VanB family oxidoreductase [unclassified Streptomyces]|uniref:PDR/VanB family oxidoreductase n=1 Tax=unclassified Streptomyces TaxID=2593676 RepID=UPI0004C49080|nr:MULTISPECIES: PDR/VanB family oxidoreductase [unclassified Streptomyces]MDX3771463.1 PDR/VanB family oxidoreductase [Streptomyces sp. AK08-01B]MDX3819006.1 PDR/VanB family oxidoreductase [Streptomyces sp. AK08-01A]